MDAILMNFDNSITTDPHRLLINNLNKINLKINMLRYQTLAFTIHEKTSKKSHTKIINLKYQLRHGLKSLNYLMDHILYQIFKIALNIS